MNTLKWHSLRLIVQLYPTSFRERFGEEMLMDYRQACASNLPAPLLRDGLLALARQWLEVFRFTGARRLAIPAGRTFLTQQRVLGFEEPLTPYELTRGFMLSVLLFSAFWYGENPMRGSLAEAFRSLLPAHTTTPDLPLTPSATIVIEDVTVMDLRQGNLLPHRTVVINDGMITSVVNSGARDRWPGADKVDGRGKFLMPGMWDMHTHIDNTSVDFPMYIANGVLGIRSMGGVQDKVFAWHKALKDGSLFGPLAFVSGPILDSPDGPVHPADYGVRIANAEQGRAEVDDLKARGADFVKVYDGLSRESYFAIAAEGQKVGLPVAGHVPDAITILEAVHAGQRSIEHGIARRGETTAEQELIDRRKTHDFMAQAMATHNFSLIPDGIAAEGNIWREHFSQQCADSLYRELVRNGTYLCPTLITGYWVAHGDELATKPDARKQYINPKTLVYWQPSMNLLTKYRTPTYLEWIKVQYAMLLEQIPRQQARGVQLLAGTDLTVPYTYPGSSVHDEIRAFAAAGLTPLQALQTATTHPVAYFGLEKSYGSVDAGKKAELVLLEGNPLQDLANLDHIDAVITHKRVLRRGELDAMMAKAAQAAQSSK